MKTITHVAIVGITMVSGGFPQAYAGGLPNNPDLLFSVSTGNVQINADGASIGTFTLTNGTNAFAPPADFGDLDADVGLASLLVTNTASQIGWTSALATGGTGFDGPRRAKLGNILPSGLDVAGVAALLATKLWVSPVIGDATTSGDFDILYAADFDEDGGVDGADLTGSASSWDARYGIDLDGFDFLNWQRDFGAGVSISALSAVPEPATWTFCLGVLLSVTASRNRR